MSMTQRERLMRQLAFQPVDRGVDYEFGVWQQTAERWLNEGLPADKFDGVWGTLSACFNLDHERSLRINTGLLPGFSFTVLEEKDDHQVIMDEDGATCERINPAKGASIPRYIKMAIESREDWEKIKSERLDPENPERVPADMEAEYKKALDEGLPVTAGCGSLYGRIRNWMGVERLSIAVCEDPQWVEEMMEHMATLTLRVLEKIAGRCAIDFTRWWEDMCFNNGPLLAPSYIREWMVPRYRRITDILRNEFGCRFNILDCDGKINDVAGLWMEGGINVMFPLESAHTDAFDLSRRFGTRMPLCGGYDKRALIAGKKAIDAEFKRLEPLYRLGGFIPHTDHLVPPDVSWENYLYYRRRKCELIGKEFTLAF